MPVKQRQHDKPVQLQLNNSGAWKTIASFDAEDAVATGYIHEAAKMLHMVNPGGKFRIATRDSLPVVLMRLGDDLEWRLA